MTTSDLVRETALSLARTEPNREEAIRQLEACCHGNRVSAVRARQQVVAWLDSEPDQVPAMRAVELLDELVDRLTV